jgi:hypothetical protein
MYLDVLNDDMVGFAKISARGMLDHLVTTYGNITAVDLENNFEHMPGGMGSPTTCWILVQADSRLCRLLWGRGRHYWTPTANQRCICKNICNWELHERLSPVERTAANRQHKQMQGESAATVGYHSANAAVGQTEDQMNEATIGALANLATATAADLGVVATLTEANARLAKQLEDNSNELQELKALIKKERFEMRGQRSFNPSPNNYCWTHSYKVANTNTSLSCNFPKQGHNREATRTDNMGGSQANKEWCSGATTLNKKSMFEDWRSPHYLSHMKQQLWILYAQDTFC